MRSIRLLLAVALALTACVEENKHKDRTAPTVTAVAGIVNAVTVGAVLSLCLFSSTHAVSASATASSNRMERIVSPCAGGTGLTGRSWEARGGKNVTLARSGLERPGTARIHWRSWERGAHRLRRCASASRA